MFGEILAPVGSAEALIAAVRSGANAVYLGAKTLNARRNASNFSNEELEAAVEYCHARNVKVYLTLNTLVSDDELKSAYEVIKLACKISVDALILQDLGLVALVRRVCSSVPMHASTQMSVQSVFGIQILKDLGFVRTVLPRELSKKEINAISYQTDIELEHFVHGANCMCVSGQCLMSSVLGGRSGNRGLCAQPCRLPFGVNSKGGHCLSLKDNSLVGKLNELSEIGVCSFKIEGRMKRPEYVAAAVTACKNSINNIDNKEIGDSLQAVFSRSGFTDGYYNGKREKDMFGTRRKEDVQSASTVLGKLKHLYENENPLISTDFKLTFKENEPIRLCASALGKSVEISENRIPEKAVNKPLEKSDLENRISKCGGTQFYANKVETDFSPGLTLPVGVINTLRRNALSALEKEISARREIEVSNFDFDIISHKPVGFAYHARFFDENQIPENLDGVSRVILPIESCEETVEKLCRNGIETAIEIPVSVFDKGEEYIKKLSKLKKSGASLAWICTLDGAGIAKEADIPFAFGFGTNIFNTPALEEAEKIGAKDCLLSCEISLRNALRLGGDIPRGVLICGKIPLMVTRNCPVKNRFSCAECRGKSTLVDRMGISFPVVCKNGASFILNSRPLWVADKKSELEKLDFGLIYFTNEGKEECGKIMNRCLKAQKADGDFTSGLYFKKVL